jgi:DNA polymerase-3 subunit gamma/tau
MENVDRMQESSRNALLSILEEPPENVYFILTTTRRSLVIQTLLSRLRPYAFVERAPSDQREVLRRIFQEESGDYESLREYFLAWRDLNPYSLKGLARTFLEMVETEKNPQWMPMDDMAELMVRSSRQQRSSSEEALSVFCEELLLSLRQRLRKGEPTAYELARLQAWAELIQGSLLVMGSMNLHPQLVLEDLFLRMREMA